MYIFTHSRLTFASFLVSPDIDSLEGDVHTRCNVRRDRSSKSNRHNHRRSLYEPSQFSHKNNRHQSSSDSVRPCMTCSLDASPNADQPDPTPMSYAWLPNTDCHLQQLLNLDHKTWAGSLWSADLYRNELSKESSYILGAYMSTSSISSDIEVGIDANEEIILDCGTSRDSSTSLVGFLILETVLDEASVTNLVVEPARRNRGIAKNLIKLALASFKGPRKGVGGIDRAITWTDQSHGVQVLHREVREFPEINYFYLEVRESNHPARRAYETCGFKLRGKRKNFYENPCEDACLYSFESLVL